MGSRQRGGVCPWSRYGPLLLVALSLIAYSRFLPGAFLYDDAAIVQFNPLVQRWDPAGIFRSGWWQGSNPDRLYRPLTVLSFSLNRILFGPGPLPFILVNIGLHTATGIALHRVLRTLPAGEHAALLAAALFVAHPMHAEVVAMAVGRAEILASLFVLLGLLAARGGGPGRDLSVAGLYAAALLSKENAAVFPLLLLLTDHFTNRLTGRFTGRPAGGIASRRRLYLLLLLVAGGYALWRYRLGLLTYGTVTIHPLDNPLATLPPLSGLLAALGVQGAYLGKILFPTGFQVLYGRSSLSLVTDPFSVPGLLSLLAAAAGAAAIAGGWRRRAAHSWGFCWYLAAFLVTGNFFFPVAMAMADRFAYLPSAGLLLAVVAVGARALGTGEQSPTACGRASRPAGWLLSGALLALAVAMIARRAPEFRDNEALWRAVVRRDAGNNWAWVNLGQALAAGGKEEEAERAFLTSIDLEPGTQEPYIAFGELLLLSGRHQDALAWTLRGVRESGGGGGELQTRVARAHLGLGNGVDAALWTLMVVRTDPGAAAPHEGVIELLERAAGNPDVPAPERARTLALLRLLAADPQGAAAALAAATAPEDAVTLAIRGEIALRQGRIDDGVSFFGKAAALEPLSEIHRLNLGSVLYRAATPGEDPAGTKP